MLLVLWFVGCRTRYLELLLCEYLISYSYPIARQKLLKIIPILSGLLRPLRLLDVLVGGWNGLLSQGLFIEDVDLVLDVLLASWVVLQILALEVCL